MNSRSLFRFLVDLAGKTKELDFVSPEFGGQRVDSHAIGQKILNISYSDWKMLGFSKGTLHYMKQNAKSDKPFTLKSLSLSTAMFWSGLKLGKTWFQGAKLRLKVGIKQVLGDRMKKKICKLPKWMLNNRAEFHIKRNN